MDFKERSKMCWCNRYKGIKGYEKSKVSPRPPVWETRGCWRKEQGRSLRWSEGPDELINKALKVLFSQMPKMPWTQYSEDGNSKTGKPCVLRQGMPLMKPTSLIPSFFHALQSHSHLCPIWSSKQPQQVSLSHLAGEKTESQKDWITCSKLYN